MGRRAPPPSHFAEPAREVQRAGPSVLGFMDLSQAVTGSDRASEEPERGRVHASSGAP